VFEKHFRTRAPMYLLTKSYQQAIILLLLIRSVVSTSCVHDNSFHPDYILRATAQNISVACQSRYSVVINETSPGPAIYMEEGKTTWVRVYNDMPDQNLTVVSPRRTLFIWLISRGCHASKPVTLSIQRHSKDFSSCPSNQSPYSTGTVSANARPRSLTVHHKSANGRLRR
jgi:hypothetical protein